MSDRWRSRIVGHGEEDPTQLLGNPSNFRIHPKPQQDALSGVLSEVGWVQDVVVNQRTQHVIDGHLRVSLAISRREPTVPVVYVDLDEAEEKLVLATFDPISAMAAADKEQLDALLHEVATGDTAVQAMLSQLAEREGLIPNDVQMGSLADLANIAPKDCEQLTFVVHLGKSEAIRERVKAIAAGNLNPDDIAPMTWALEQMLEAYERSDCR